MANPKPHAIVFPYPYQGHVTPMINLSLNLASKGFTVTFVQTEFIHHSISKAHNLLSPPDFDLFAQARKLGLDIRYTTVSDGFPLEFDRDLHFDEYWESMFRDFPTRVDQIIAKTTKLAKDQSLLAPPPSILIADTFYSWPATIAKKHNLVNVSLWTEPAIVFSVNYHLDLLRNNGHFPSTASGDGDNLVNYIPGVQSINMKDLMSYVQEPGIIPTLTEVVVKGFEQVKEVDFILCNTVQELESDALSALNQKHPTYAIGPINFYDFTEISIPRSLWPESDCTRWLNSKPSGSVLYVSVGSIAQSNKLEIEEFAHGLLQSKVYFVWILRPDILEENETLILPTGFEEAIKDQGLIVPWCNQKEVLSSLATGGFLTHCGWNSVLESIWYGVPMICYPFLVDQPTNRKLVVHDWKIGINLCEGERVTREEVSMKIGILMRGKMSTEIKQEIKNVSQKMHDSLATQGSSTRNFEKFVEDLEGKIARIKPMISS